MDNETFESVKISKNKLKYYEDTYEKTKQEIIINILKELKSKYSIKDINYRDLKL
jgi:hypothetical protein|tara:strand:+ start:450 stop:614 length:165 start_codon:yes stop_codon:yes gene_type:complete